INAATAELVKEMLRGRGCKKSGKGKGEEGSGGEGESVNEKARIEAQEAQERLAEELKKLGEKFGGVSSEEMKRRVEELEKEARQISRMLEEPHEEVTERQDRFLARMLQAALSLHREEDEKEERKSTTAKTIFDTNKNIKLDTLLLNKQDLFYLLRRRAIEEGNYPASYRTSINTYFDSLRSVYIIRGESKDF
ncbi:MAG: hypothetical protein N2053_12920, partial [Chitinispirillaceae bacterium]|nr:hypothetical protein [Chitinispirillaceae bacterium]